jgi:hypothetical protein
MPDLTKVTDRKLVLEIYRRIKSESEIHGYLNYLYRAAFHSIYTFYINYGDNSDNVCVVNFCDYGVNYYDKNLSSVVRRVRKNK